MYSYLADDCYVKKKTKVTKKGVIKREIKFEDYKKGLENNGKTFDKSKFTQNVSKIALIVNDDTILQTLDRVTSGAGSDIRCWKSIESSIDKST